MRPLSIVVVPPCFDDDLCLGETVEDFAVKQFVPQLRVEALAVTVLPWTSGFDEGGPCADCDDPLPHGPGDELRAVAPTEGRICDRRAGARSFLLQARTGGGGDGQSEFL